jgi:hypothetical protein
LSVHVCLELRQLAGVMRFSAAPLVISALIIVPLFGYGIFVRPRTGSAAVTSAHQMDNGLVLTVEKVRGGTKSIVPTTQRLRLTDPLTGQQRGFTLCDEFPTW